MQYDARRMSQSITGLRHPLETLFTEVKNLIKFKKPALVTMNGARSITKTIYDIDCRSGRSRAHQRIYGRRLLVAHINADVMWSERDVQFVYYLFFSSQTAQAFNYVVDFFRARPVIHRFRSLQAKLSTKCKKALYGFTLGRKVPRLILIHGFFLRLGRFFRPS